MKRAIKLGYRIRLIYKILIYIKDNIIKINWILIRLGNNCKNIGNLMKLVACQKLMMIIIIIVRADILMSIFREMGICI